MDELSSAHLTSPTTLIVIVSLESFCALRSAMSLASLARRRGVLRPRPMRATPVPTARLAIASPNQLICCA